MIATRRMKDITTPDIIAIITAIAALFSPVLRGWLDRNKSDAEADQTRANTFNIISDVQAGLIERMNNQIAKLEEKAEKQEQKIEKLEKRIDDLEGENQTWQREYRVLWDGAKRNAIQIIQLGEIPVFDPPDQIFRGTITYDGED